jgi:hypothetical protein
MEMVHSNEYSNYEVILHLEDFLPRAFELGFFLPAGFDFFFGCSFSKSVSSLSVMLL